MHRSRGERLDERACLEFCAEDRAVPRNGIDEGKEHVRCRQSDDEVNAGDKKFVLM